MCSLQTLRRYKGSDDDLLITYAEALEDVRRYLGKPQPAYAALRPSLAQTV